MVKLCIIIVSFVACIAASLGALTKLQTGGYRGRIAVYPLLGGLIKCAVSASLCAVSARYAGRYACVGYFTAVGISVIGHVAVYLRRRTKLKLTRRACRLLVSVCAVYVGLSVAAALLIESELHVVLCECAIICLSAPVAHIVACAVYPLEKANNYRYIRRAEAELDVASVIKIGITGSYGKTSCKYILAEMLKSRYRVIVTDGNYNTPTGIAKTVFANAELLGSSLQGKPLVFIAEMGARYVGDIAELARIVKPDYAIITGVGEQHSETFGNIENVAFEKSELARYVRKKGGFVAYNADNPYTNAMCEKFGGISVGTFGGDYVVTGLTMSADGLTFGIRGGNDKIFFKTSLIGRHNALNIGMCFALARALGVTEEALVSAVSALEAVPHRLELKHLDGITVIDDGYNANYEGVISALETLAYFRGRKVVYAQGIVELGRKQKSVNIDVGRAVSRVANVVILSGQNARSIRRGLAEGNFCGKIIEFKSMREATAHLSSVLCRGDVVLFQNDIP